MPEHYTNESAAHLLLSMTSIVEKPEDCEALRKCLNKAVDNAVYEKDRELDKLRRYQMKLTKRIVYLSTTCLEASKGIHPAHVLIGRVFCPTPDHEDNNNA